MRLPVVMLAVASLLVGTAAAPQALAKPKDPADQTQTQKKKKVNKAKKGQPQEEKKPSQ